MNVPGTLTFADLYGSAAPGRSKGDVTERDASAASGNMPAIDTKRPAMYWVVLVGLLVVVRWLAEKKGR